MSEIASIEVPLGAFLWWTRGENWDRELVASPKGLKSDNWGRLFSLLLPTQPDRHKVTTKLGRLDLEGGFSFFLASAFESRSHKDWTNRPIPHYIVLFIPGCESMNHFKEKVEVFPEDWPLQLEETYLGRYYKSSLFLLPEDEVRSWRETKTVPFQKFVQQEFSQILPKTVVFNSKKPFLDYSPSEFMCEGVFLDSALNNERMDENLLTYDISFFPDRLRKEFRDELDRLCKAFAEKTESECFKDGKENAKMLIEIISNSFNGEPTDISVRDLAERTIKLQNNGVGFIKKVLKCAQERFVFKPADGKNSSHSSEASALEKLAIFLAKHALSELRRIKNDEDGQRWLADLFPKALYNDQTIRALFIRAKFLADQSTSL